MGHRHWGVLAALAIILTWLTWESSLVMAVLFMLRVAVYMVVIGLLIRVVRWFLRMIGLSRRSTGGY